MLRWHWSEIMEGHFPDSQTFFSTITNVMMKSWALAHHHLLLQYWGHYWLSPQILKLQSITSFNKEFGRRFILNWLKRFPSSWQWYLCVYCVQVVFSMLWYERLVARLSDGVRVSPVVRFATNNKIHVDVGHVITITKVTIIFI